MTFIPLPIESNGAVPVNVQDQHTKALDLRFIKALASPTTLAANAAVGALTISVTASAGFADGVTVAVFSPAGDFYFGEQVGATAGAGPYTITLDTPIDVGFTSGDNVLAANHHLNVDGSGTTQVFQIGPVGGATGVEIDITRIMGNMTDNAVMTDELFGSMAALTNGIVLRRNNDVISNIWNMKTNGALALMCFDATYPDKLPTGVYAFRFRNTFAGQSKHGVTIRLDPGDTLELLVQDDLTDLTDFQMIAQGHVVTD